MAILPKKSVLELPDFPPPTPNRRGKVRMDLGENTTAFSGALLPGFETLDIQVYPEYDQVLDQLSRHHGMPRDCISLTNGSDDALMLLPQTFIEPLQDVAVISSPTFIVISHGLKLSGASIEAVPVLSDFRHDLQSLEQRIRATSPKMVVLASPDNPCGYTIDPERIASWTKTYRDTLFVLDEAYYEYTLSTVLPLVQARENLIVTRTFSKAWGMAGLRLGVVFGAPELIRYFNRVKLIFTVNCAAVRHLMELLPHEGEVLATAKQTMERKSKLVDSLLALDYELVSGEANFFLLRMADRCDEFVAQMAANGVLVKRCAPAGAPSVVAGMVRVSVGTEEENARFLQIAESFAKQFRAELQPDCHRA